MAEPRHDVTHGRHHDATATGIRSSASSRRRPEVGPRLIARFRPADLPRHRPRPIATSTGVTVRHELRWPHRPGARLLDGDPTAVAPLSMGRLGLHAAAGFAVTFAVALAVFAIVPTLVGYDSVVVTSGSMRPALRPADVVVTRPPSSAARLTEGTVINYSVPGGGSQLHRIVGATAVGYRTAGDANATADSDLVDASRIEGVGVLVVPFAGYPARWARTGRWVPLAATAVMLAAAGYVSCNRFLEPSRQRMEP